MSDTVKPPDHYHLDRGAAHALGDALSIIRGEAELALRLANSREEYRDALQVILAEARRMEALIVEFINEERV